VYGKHKFETEGTRRFTWDQGEECMKWCSRNSRSKSHENNSSRNSSTARAFPPHNVGTALHAAQVTGVHHISSPPSQKLGGGEPRTRPSAAHAIHSPINVSPALKTSMMRDRGNPASQLEKDASMQISPKQQRPWSAERYPRNGNKMNSISSAAFLRNDGPPFLAHPCSPPSTARSPHRCESISIDVKKRGHSPTRKWSSTTYTTCTKGPTNEAQDVCSPHFKRKDHGSWGRPIESCSSTDVLLRRPRSHSHSVSPQRSSGEGRRFLKSAGVGASSPGHEVDVFLRRFPRSHSHSASPPSRRRFLKSASTDALLQAKESVTSSSHGPRERLEHGTLRPSPSSSSSSLLIKRHFFSSTRRVAPPIGCRMNPRNGGFLRDDEGITGIPGFCKARRRYPRESRGRGVTGPGLGIKSGGNREKSRVESRARDSPERSVPHGSECRVNSRGISTRSRAEVGGLQEGLCVGIGWGQEPYIRQALKAD